jgi:hypothetical protein
MAVFGSNLLDREHFAVTAHCARTSDSTRRFCAPPRMYGCEITCNC